ncbi:uncharacterized protein G2W53_017177 [Senna tora]|uniref:Uncharacterized protein n=1 Tax=Senna tora TaxID=362788 RepID=A0A834TPG6_9FABA|nr:uncharacterized protein G2W53_017177 [Senna tora]
MRGELDMRREARTGLELCEDRVVLVNEFGSCSRKVLLLLDYTVEIWISDPFHLGIHKSSDRVELIPTCNEDGDQKGRVFGSMGCRRGSSALQLADGKVVRRLEQLVVRRNSEQHCVRVGRMPKNRGYL